MNHRLACLVSVIASAFALAASPVRADAPTLLPVQGYLADLAGALLDGAFNIRFRLYATDLGGTPLFEETPSVLVDNGYFTVYLGETAALPLTIFSQNSSVFLGVRIGNDAESTPFIELATAPYAAFAQYCAEATHAAAADTATNATTASFATSAGDAATLGGATAASLQTWSGLTGVPASFPPSAHGHVVGDVTGAQALVAGSCGAGASINAINSDGSVTCEVDDNTTYTVSTGLTLFGNTIGLDQSTVQSWCYDTETELTAVLDDNYAALAHTHAAASLTGDFGAITSTGVVTGTNFQYVPARSFTRWYGADQFRWEASAAAGMNTLLGTQPVAIAFDAVSPTGPLIFSTVDLPANATVTSFDCHFVDADTGIDGFAIAALRRHTFNPALPGYESSSPALASVTTTGSSNARATASASVSHAVVAGSEYSIRITLLLNGTANSAPSGLRFHGCSLTFTATGPGY